MSVTSAQEVEASKDSFAKGISVDPFFALESVDLDTDKDLGAGLRIGYEIFNNLELQTEILSFEQENSFVDRVYPSILFNAQINDRIAFQPFGGVGRDLEDDEWDFYVGLGTDLKIYKGFTFNLSGRMVRPVESEGITALFTTGFGYKF